MSIFSREHGLQWVSSLNLISVWVSMMSIYIISNAARSSIPIATSTLLVFPLRRVLYSIPYMQPLIQRAQHSASEATYLGRRVSIYHNTRVRSSH